MKLYTLMAQGGAPAKFWQQIDGGGGRVERPIVFESLDQAEHFLNDLVHWKAKHLSVVEVLDATEWQSR